MRKNKKQNGGAGAADYGVQVWGGFDQVNDPSQGNVIKVVGIQQPQVQHTGGGKRNRYKKIKGGGDTAFIIPSGDIPASTTSPLSSISPGTISSQIGTLLANSSTVLNSATTQLANTNPATLMETTTSTNQTANINSESRGGGKKRRKTQKTQKKKQRKSKKRFC
jgi:hypothetical protein